MRHVVIEAVHVGDADDAFARICDFERYPDLTDAVRSVVVEPAEDGSLATRWEANFRNGVICWSERDVVDVVARTVTFQQTTGDFEVFEGSWEVLPEPLGCRIVFRASFDLGIPTLAPLIDPVAEQALRENVALILEGLLGIVEVLPPDAPRQEGAADLAGVPA